MALKPPLRLWPIIIGILISIGGILFLVIFWPGGGGGGGAQQLYDFGDAPDNGGPTYYPANLLPRTSSVGYFPSLLTNNGARAKDNTGVTIGPSASLENDSKQVNMDDDNGLKVLNAVATTMPPQSTFSVQVSSQRGGTYYLNVLIDLDEDGKWGGPPTTHLLIPEWVVQNFQFSMPPNSSKFITSPPFIFAWDETHFFQPAWIRTAVTSERINSADWTGTGEFKSGEIEDDCFAWHARDCPVPQPNGVNQPLITLNTTNTDLTDMWQLPK